MHNIKYVQTLETEKKLNTLKHFYFNDKFNCKYINFEFVRVTVEGLFYYYQGAYNKNTKKYIFL